VDAIVLDIATNLASTLLVAGGRRLGQQALGNDQEQALKNAFAEATAAMLVEIARHADLDRKFLDHLKEQFNGFFEDRWIAETLVDVALDSEAPPVDELRRRYEQLDFDSEALPVSFERAMHVFAFELATRLRDDARSGGPLAGIVMVADIEAMRGMLEEHVQARGASGPGVDELWKESRARCAERWRRLGLSREEAFELADDLLVGAPGPRAHSALRRPLTIVMGEVGAGKSLLLDRLFQRAVVRLREDPVAPLPAFVEAADVEGRLQDAVVRKTSSLGNPREQGAAVFLDGAEEGGRDAAGRLLRDARILAETWPNTAVVIAGRPLPDFVGQEETISVPELDAGEQMALIERISGREVTPGLTYYWPQSIKEAVKRPLFATLLALDLKTQDISNPRSTGELLSGLVERAFSGTGETVDTGVLMRLAAACIDRGGPVRAADVATTAEIARLRQTGLVLERAGAVSISLQILTEWFAAQALESGLVDPRQLASDFARLERWRYPLAIAVATFGYAWVQEIFGHIAVSAPAFASQVVSQALAYSTIRQEAPSTPPSHFAEQMRDTMASWVAGIGKLASLIAPVRKDGSLQTLGLSIFRGEVHDYSWYSGQEPLGDWVSLYERLPDGMPGQEWRRVRAVGPQRQAAWVWRYTLEDLAKELSEHLKKRRLPISGGLLLREAAWEAARILDRSFGGQLRPEQEPIPLKSLDECLEMIGGFQDGHTDEVHIGGMSGRARIYDLRYMKSEMRRLRTAGVTEITSPWPTADRWDDPKLRHTGTGGVYIWEPYSPETLLARVQIIFEGALEGYRRFVEEYFAQLAPHMQIATALPARLTGTLILSHIDTRIDRTPYVAWHLDPLRPGSKNEVQIDIGKERAAREHMLEAAGWIVSPQYADSEFFGKTPATELAYEWLWDDLRRVSWVKGMFNRRFS
jgi:hypothetical protein